MGHDAASDHQQGQAQGKQKKKERKKEKRNKLTNDGSAAVLEAKEDSSPLGIGPRPAMWLFCCSGGAFPGRDALQKQEDEVVAPAQGKGDHPGSMEGLSTTVIGMKTNEWRRQMAKRVDMG